MRAPSERRFSRPCRKGESPFTALGLLDGARAKPYPPTKVLLVPLPEGEQATVLIERQPGADWRDLQERVAVVLRECGLDSEVARTLQTVRGKVEVDVYATDSSTTPPAILLCECKRWSSRVPKAEVKSFRTDVADFGAHFGLFISSCGFQSGAHDVVENTNVRLVDWQGFQDLFLERWCSRYWVPTMRKRGDRLAASVEPIDSDAGRRFAKGEGIQPAEAAGLFMLDLWGSPFLGLEAMIGLPTQPVADAIWGQLDTYQAYLPESVLAAGSLRELLDALAQYAEQWFVGRQTDA